VLGSTMSPGRYVMVGFSELYPDRCLITASNPAHDTAWQFLEVRSGKGFQGVRLQVGPQRYSRHESRSERHAVECVCGRKRQDHAAIEQQS
jgi:hypothetical protein